MKELDDFTVERLRAIAEPNALVFPPSHAEAAALARIALAAKTATPAYWITYYPNPDQNEFDDREHSHSGAKSCAVRIAGEIGGFVVPVYYGAPPMNSPELPDGWKLLAEQKPEVGEEVIIGTSDGSLDVATWCGDHFDDGDFFNHITWPTHWKPRPAPPTTEK